MKHKLLLSIPLFLMMAACANTGADYTPIVDGRRSPDFKQDLAACRHVAQDRKWLNGDTKQNMAIGATAGALLGAAESEGEAGDIVGGAIAGVVGGGLVGAAQSNKERKAIVIECMKQRGHRVVG